jgi:hypothetical protein
MDFHEICIFRKSVKKIQVWLKSNEITGIVSGNACVHRDCICLGMPVYIVTVSVWECLCTSWLYLSEFFLDWEIFQTKFVEAINTLLCWKIGFRKSCHLWVHVIKCGRARQTIGDKTVRRTCFACWITKAADTSRDMQYSLLFHGKHYFCECALTLRYKYIAYLVCFVDAIPQPFRAVLTMSSIEATLIWISCSSDVPHNLYLFSSLRQHELLCAVSRCK